MRFYIIFCTNVMSGLPLWCTDLRFGLPRASPPLQSPFHSSCSLLLDFLLPPLHFKVQSAALSRSFWTSSCLPSASKSNPPLLLAPFGLPPASPLPQGPIRRYFSLLLDFLLPLQSSPNLCVNSSFSYVVLSTLLLSSRDLTEWSLVYHSTLSYQRFYDLHSIHYDHLEGLHQLI